jgi:C1A family cysteine protease
MKNGPFELDQLALLLRQTGARWTAGVTPLVELSRAEKRQRLGADPPLGQASWDERELKGAAHKRPEYGAAEKAQTVPAAYDWRDVGGKDFMTPVQNQKNCGSCVAFGSVATVESSIRIKRNDPALAIDLSEAHLFYCHGAAQGKNCNSGWWVDPALNAFRDIGVVDEACFPYTPGDQACKPCTDWQNRVQKILSWQAFTTPADMKTWLSTKGPLVGCLKVYDDFYSYKSGVYEHKTGDFLGGHCICVIGYSDADSSWICKNSWGPNWGEQGYFRIAYGECAIDYSMWGVEIPVTDTGNWLDKKLITGLWTVNQNRTAGAYIDGIGWRRVSAENDSSFAAMVMLLASAKNSKSVCKLRVEGEIIKEIYVL